MIITAIKAQIKDPNRVSIFVDGRYSFSLTLNDILQTKLKKDLIISDADLLSYKKLSSDGKLKQRTYEWLLNRPRSTKELKEYFYHKKVDSDLQEKLILEFTNKNILNDKRFAQWSAERLNRKNKSIRAITGELKSKGISNETIQSTMLESNKNDSDALQALILKLSTRSRYQDTKKLIAYLVYKGFRYEDIKQALEIREPE